MIVFLIPLGLLERKFCRDGKVEWFAHKSDLRYQVYVHIIIASMFWAVNLSCWVIAWNNAQDFV
jgi:hypothetical protein